MAKCLTRPPRYLTGIDPSGPQLAVKVDKGVSRASPARRKKRFVSCVHNTMPQLRRASSIQVLLSIAYVREGINHPRLFLTQRQDGKSGLPPSRETAVAPICRDQARQEGKQMNFHRFARSSPVVCAPKPTCLFVAQRQLSPSIRSTKL